MQTLSVHLRSKVKKSRVIINSKQKKLQDRVLNVYNKIHDFNNNDETNKAIRELKQYKEKILLIDKILKRREQITDMTQVQKIQDNFQLFDAIRKKWLGNLYQKEIHQKEVDDYFNKDDHPLPLDQNNNGNKSSNRFKNENDASAKLEKEKNLALNLQKFKFAEKEIKNAFLKPETPELNNDVPPKTCNDKPNSLSPNLNKRKSSFFRCATPGSNQEREQNDQILQQVTETLYRKKLLSSKLANGGSRNSLQYLSIDGQKSQRSQSSTSGQSIIRGPSFVKLDEFQQKQRAKYIEHRKKLSNIQSQLKAYIQSQQLPYIQHPKEKQQNKTQQEKFVLMDFIKRCEMKRLNQSSKNLLQIEQGRNFGQQKCQTATSIEYKQNRRIYNKSMPTFKQNVFIAACSQNYRV